MRLVDTHCHLNLIEERNEIIKKFDNENMEFVIEVGIDIDNSFNTVELANTYEKIYASVGIHPNDSSNLSNKDFDTIKILASNEKVIAIGEIGLDYYREYTTKKDQYKSFINQLEIAKEIGLPVILHIREAYEDAFNLLVENGIPDKLGVVHCFSSDWKTARKFLDLGFYIGIDGPITFKNNHKLVEVVKNTPIEMILPETDSPFLTPVPYRGKRNNPLYVKYVIEKIAEIKEISIDETSEILLNNAKKAFSIK
ncbi:hydrolase, TatD family [Marinitoga piezophila KA3]|uniref:Hydrolase, TatD family n=1 Tax=Marinitoga piezophila (strain DSM 14283 / JCM 11233 / KA3) TaxID=443254 RepID=H2J6B0_MARPK|nr:MULTISPECIES: TatD family hydrolase [Marinitoga]AEX86258.1 hydrolase, TatD family [Marinitoga piezophila KA3]APT76666.1 hydrolase TatD [Marinitoga sp. 1137]NUU98358.1 hydrolase TatD [Marinitoga sp. 1138]